MIRLRTHHVLLASALCVGLAAGCDVGYEDDTSEELGVDPETPGGPTGAAVQGEALGGYDQDVDERLDLQEFTTFAERELPFSDWDTDADGELSPAEVSAMAVDLWDRDDQQGVTREEFEQGAPIWFGEREYADWPEWDANRDEMLDASEVEAQLQPDTPWWVAWDVDQSYTLNETEYTGGWFDTFDRDGDEFVDEDEYRGIEGLWSW